MRRAALLSALLPIAASADTLEVGPGKPFATPCAAIGSAQAGDRIEVDAAGSYDGDTCEWTTDNLTVVGINGRAKIDLTGVTPAQDKGIFTIDAPNATIESFELSGAAISQADGNNGAGIRHGGINLTVIDCYLHDNQDGILGSPPTAGSGSVTIQATELYNNGAGDGFSHNMYLGDYGTVTVIGSYSHHANVGHLLKSRGYVNNIMYNALLDETGGTASYEIDLPQGGTSTIVGNFIEQSAASMNPLIITSGEETPLNPTQQQVYLVNNTIVNDLSSGTFTSFVAGTTAVVENNIFHGAGTITTGGSAMQVTNWTDAQGDPMLGSDYDLSAGSPCIDAGTLPMQALIPTMEYVAPLMLVGRTVAGSAIDIGADEVGGQVALGGDGNPIGDDVDGGNGSSSAGKTNSGCGCQSRGGDAPSLAIILIFAVALARRGANRRACARSS
jgi:hypothetical protein